MQYIIIITILNYSIGIVKQIFTLVVWFGSSENIIQIIDTVYIITAAI